MVLCFLLMGSFLQVNLVWELADLFNGLMVLPNILAVIGLYRLVTRAVSDYDDKFLQNKRPLFGPSEALTNRFASLQAVIRRQIAKNQVKEKNSFDE